MRMRLAHVGTNSYTRWIEDCERRYKAGQRQSVCTQCGLWKWPDEYCCGKERWTAKQHAQEIKKAERDAEAWFAARRRPAPQEPRP